MDERKDRSARKRKRLRQKRRAWFVVILFFLCIMLISFWGGFIAGNSWQKDTDRKTPAESYTLDARPISGMLDNDTDESAKFSDNSDSQWNLMLVNKWNPIPDNYEVNLVEVEGGEYVDERIYEPLMEMLEDAKEANWDQLPLVVSGYRTTEKQQKLYDEKISEYRRKGYSDSEAEELAQQWVAIPGYSEHQLGFAVDINGATYDVYLWMQENSYKYGFIFRYPGHKTEKTGVAEEIWHYRYVGTEAAAEIYEQGICLEEYLENYISR